MDAGFAVATEERQGQEGILVIDLCDERNVEGDDEVLRVVPYGSRSGPPDGTNSLTGCGILASSCAGRNNGSNWDAGAGSAVEATPAINAQVTPIAPRQTARKRACAESPDGHVIEGTLLPVPDLQKKKKDRGRPRKKPKALRVREVVGASFTAGANKTYFEVAGKPSPKKRAAYGSNLHRYNPSKVEEQEFVGVVSRIC